MTVVETTAGALRGAIVVTRRADVQIFLGVPFADAPTGANRFRPPQPAPRWAGVRDASRYGPAVPQNPDPVLSANGYHQPRSDEAAGLNLNVWTPRADDRRRPVMVWIHGGANVNGSNSAGYTSGAELAATFDVVVVSVNYRLGALGFLSLAGMIDDAESSGNNAVLDQLAALRWVADNIERFGGDPAAVTVFGESAGAAAVGTLLGAPASQGLFARAIMQSGTAERVLTLESAEELTGRFLRHAGLTPRTAGRLRDLPVAGILEAQAALQREVAQAELALPLPFQSVVDGRVLPQPPLDSVRDGVNSAVELLAGTNTNEAAFFIAHHPDDEVPARRRALAASHLGGDEDAYSAALAEVLRRPPTDAELVEALLSDLLYRQPTNRLLDARASSSGASYAYLFDWRSPVEGGRLGACHALEVPFVFRQLHRIEAISLVGENPPEELSESMSAAWVRFADSGRPGSARMPDWPEYRQGTRATMILDVRAEVHSDPRGPLRRLWAEPGETRS